MISQGIKSNDRTAKQSTGYHVSGLRDKEKFGFLSTFMGYIALRINIGRSEIDI
jgi:hypothetical protein